MVDVCECSANWRVELTNLLTGAITHAIVPVSFEFETSYLEAGRGTITFNRRGTGSGLTSGYVSANDTFPGAVGIFFQRIAGGTATPDDPVNMFGGYVETMQGNSDGTITLGFAEMQKYLDSRLIRSDLVFTALDQKFIVRDLVMYARGANINGGSVDPAPALGIPLIAGFGGGLVIARDRTYLAADRTVIGDAIKNFMGILDGPIYRMDHHRNPTVGLTDGWYSEMFVGDTWTQASPAPFVTWHHLTDFTVNLDINEMANQIDAFGDPNADGTPRIATANSPTPFLPRWDAAPSFDGVTNLITLGQHASGYQDDYRDPAMNLQLVFSGLEYGTAAFDYTLSIDDLVPGNAVNIDIRSPNWTIEGGPDIPGAGTHIPHFGRVSVAVQPEGPEQVTVQTTVDSYPANMLSAPPDGCEDCG